jgi:hypothetical protein
LTPLVLLALLLACGREPVPIVIRIANTGSRAIELHLQGRTTVFDLIVSRQGTVVWRRLEGEAVAAILQLRILEPGEVLEFQDTWPQVDRAGRRVEPGKYHVSGEIPTDGEPLRAGPLTLLIGG